MRKILKLYAGICLMLVVLWSITACSAQNAPELIGSYPSNTTGNQPRSNTSKSVELVYEAEIDLQVGDVYRTSEKITQLANQYSGYLIDCQTWLLGDEDHARLIVKVPSRNFFPMYNAIKRLGDVEFETFIGESAFDYPKRIDSGEMSEIKIHLIASRSWNHTKPTKGWFPLNTIQKALAVSISIITFIIDVLIWIIVVISPLALIVLGIKRILQNIKTPKSKDLN